MPGLGRLAAVLIAVAGPLCAQVNSKEGSGGAPVCAGPSREIALAPAGSVHLGGDVTVLNFGQGLQVCFTADGVTLHDGLPDTIACAAIRDSADEGIGHYFTAEGIPHHLWLHIDPGDAVPTLEIGLYREGEELVWIDTAFPICTG